jgi:hypothetical protein
VGYVVSALLLASAAARGQTGAINSWSAWVNQPEWNQALGVTVSRQGCSNPPAACVESAAKMAAAHHFKVMLAIPLKHSTAAEWASEYSRLSVDNPFLVEVGIDDFVDQYHALFSAASVRPAALLHEVIGHLKSVNANLKFGATIYEEQLANPYLQDAKLPAETRLRFDYVHLYIHFRQDGLKYVDYVEQARQLFPNARIIAGSYAYDRRAYLPCTRSGKPCSTAEELDLYRKSIEAQVQLLHSGSVDSIEFYPGYFGIEEKWPGWSNPRSCAPGDMAACVANTKTMRQAARDAIANSPGSQSK